MAPFIILEKSVFFVLRGEGEEPQRCIQKLVEHLRWSYFAKTLNDFELLTILAKKLHLRFTTGF